MKHSTAWLICMAAIFIAWAGWGLLHDSVSLMSFYQEFIKPALYSGSALHFHWAWSRNGKVSGG